MNNYSQSLEIQCHPQAVFNALSSDIGSSWGLTDKAARGVGDTFTTTFGEAYWTFEIVEYNVESSITWKCIDGGTELNEEWIGHELKWTITPMSEVVKVDFDQLGLNASLPCYEICSAAWDRFILNSLKQYLETGKGSPGS